MNKINDWCTQHGITEVECLVADMAGIARGKILPTEKFLSGLDENNHRLPESVLFQTVTGDFPQIGGIVDPVDIDIMLEPVPATIRPVPWYEEPTAQIICDCRYADGSDVELYSRQVLKRVLSLYTNRGWQPIVAPELEFFLVKVNADPDYPLEPPIGRSGRPETGRQAFGIDAVNEFDPLFEDVYDYCEAQLIDIDTLNHESGAAQFEINFRHGDALSLADQVFLFKRTVRQTAIRHNVYATFMAKPMEREAGSSMHIHQSILDTETGRNIFVDAEGDDSPLLNSFIGGLQAYMPATLVMAAPNVNSYRRFTYYEAPINTHWGYDNRTCGFRVPASSRADRRVENRLAGADVNPYLALAGTLVAGYLGMVEGIKAREAQTESVYQLPRHLPRHLDEALRALEACQPVCDALGERFISAVVAVKDEEYRTYRTVISSWEREHLLLNV